MSAPNPWKKGFSSVKPDEDFVEQYGHPLLTIAELLQNWPGEVTVNLPPRERHNRLIQVIGGYPMIGVASMPLDWPLHPVSQKALKLSLYLDSIKSRYNELSLRSAILNLDLFLREKLEDQGEKARKKQLKKFHKMCLKLLFTSLPNSESDLEKKFTKEETKLCSTLHSTDATDMQGFWPYDKGEKDGDEVAKSFEESTIKVFKNQNIYGIKFLKIMMVKTKPWHHWRNVL
jgi:hypothetical protein